MGESGLLPEAKAASVPVRHDTREYLQACRVYHFHDTSASAGFKQARELSAANFLYGDANNLAPFLFRLRKEHPGDYQNILQAIQTVAPFFRDFYLQPGGNEDNPTILLKWLHRDYEEPFSAHQLSDGSARFICLMTLLLQPRSLRPNTLVLDEPELGLHPVALEVLAEVMQATARHNQVICSTQSVYFANRFAAEDFIVVDQQQGASVFTRPDPEQLAEWLKEYGMGDLWDKNLFGGRPQW
jgi:predicted ATPase